MRDLAIPDLTFPKVRYGLNVTPGDLRVLLYKGGAKGNSRTVFDRWLQESWEIHSFTCIGF